MQLKKVSKLQYFHILGSGVGVIAVLKRRRSFSVRLFSELSLSQGV